MLHNFLIIIKSTKQKGALTVLDAGPVRGVEVVQRSPELCMHHTYGSDGCLSQSGRYNELRQ